MSRGPRGLFVTLFVYGSNGAPTWFETLTSDTTRAIAFYEKMFGWTAKTST